VIGPEKLLGIDADMNDISDTVPTLAAIAPFAASPVTIRNVEHIRGKETDRITAVTTELRSMGITIREFFGGFTIYPCTPAPAEIHTYNDHRMAMAFAVTGLRAPGIVIADPTCTAKTFPDFFDRFTQMASSGGA
jgi:3-phosphoshikimate 1-carboxyvinyltransferase